MTQSQEPSGGQKQASDPIRTLCLNRTWPSTADLILPALLGVCGTHSAQATNADLRRYLGNVDLINITPFTCLSFAFTSHASLSLSKHLTRFIPL